jgi:hypothetical protein
MNKHVRTILLASLVGVSLLAGCSSGEQTENTAGDSTGNQTATENADTTAIPFSEVGVGIMTAKDDYKKFTFEEGTGTCLEMGYPKDMFYDSANVMMTEDGKYIENMTSVDFAGLIRFDDVPLNDGLAACKIQTTSKIDFANMTCSIDEVEVCTTTFKVFAHK